VYFAYLAGMAIAGRPSRWFVVFTVSAAVLASIYFVGMAHILPLVYLLVGYWLPALLAGAPDTRLERRLVAIDRGIFGEGGLTGFVRNAPRFLVEYLELAYLLCYAVVPAGYVWLVVTGFGPASVDRFWTAVLLAAFLCYGLLPWVPTRAPRALEPGEFPRRSSVRRLNVAVLDRASVQWNTFPSGHTAASVATALVVGSYAPVAGAAFGIIAVSIAAGSVVGRYHYAADALAGALVAAVAFAMAIVMHAP
jgi:hypothetical protein